MTVEELREEVKEDFRSLGGKLDTVGAQVATLTTECAALAATTHAASERHRSELGVLFDLARTHENRITAIETNYVKRPDFDKLVERTGVLETSQAKSGGIAWALHAVISLIGFGGIAALIQWGGK